MISTGVGGTTKIKGCKYSLPRRRSKKYLVFEVLGRQKPRKGLISLGFERKSYSNKVLQVVLELQQHSAHGGFCCFREVGNADGMGTRLAGRALGLTPPSWSPARAAALAAGGPSWPIRFGRGQRLYSPPRCLPVSLPCLPSPADRPPSGSNWIHEIKTVTGSWPGATPSASG